MSNWKHTAAFHRSRAFLAISAAVCTATAFFAGPAAAQFQLSDLPEALDGVILAGPDLHQQKGGAISMTAVAASGEPFVMTFLGCDGEGFTAQCQGLNLLSFIRPNYAGSIDLGGLNSLHNQTIGVQAYVDGDGDLAVQYWMLAGGPVGAGTLRAGVIWWMRHYTTARTWMDGLTRSVSTDAPLSGAFASIEPPSLAQHASAYKVAMAADLGPANVQPGAPLATDDDHAALNAEVAKILAQNRRAGQGDVHVERTSRVASDDPRQNPNGTVSGDVAIETGWAVPAHALSPEEFFRKVDTAVDDLVVARGGVF